MSEHKNNTWLIALLVFLAGAVSVESAMLIRSNRERMHGGWVGISPWMFTPGNPFPLLSNMRNEMDRFFAGTPFGGFNRMAMSGLEIKDSGDSYTVTAKLPGLDKSDINVSVEGRVLNVSCNENGRHRLGWFGRSGQERSYESYQSSVALPAAVDSSRMQATYKHGVLKIIVPKEDRDNDGRKVPVQ